MRRTFLYLLISFTLVISQEGNAQILFAEDCFVGGVQTGGHSTLGVMFGGSFNIKWEENYTLRRAYAICYRFGRPEPHTIYVNDGPIEWNMTNQAGPELPEENDFSNYFAPHAVDITDEITINGNIVNIDFPPQTFYDFAWNWGWWGAYLVLLYESPEITTEVCTRIYIANQSQDFPQNYSFDKPQFDESNPFLFSIFSNRLSEFEVDATAITVNGELLGHIWSGDLVTPVPGGGVQGHFFYQNGMAEGLNGDIANTQVYRQDGIADIRDYLVDGMDQSLEFTPISQVSLGSNPHPAFLLTYTPECEVSNQEMPRHYSYCRGDSVQLTGISGYDTYTWSKEKGLSDSTIANPWCSADSSGWYTLSMESDNGELCPQTIPVFVEVYDSPIPQSLTVRSSLCPANTGQVIANNTPGNRPISYSLNGNENNSGTFEDLAPGDYELTISTATGCTWDTALAVPLDPLQMASFTATPETGFSPLDVFFNNNSTEATDYQWLINGNSVSESEDITYTFPDSGTYEISLIAYRIEESCADTATFTLRVEPGIRILMPNIISPNGDGRNDRLVAQVQGLTSCRWVIYNRWGNEVASGEENNPFQEVEIWNPGDEMTEGTYSLVLVALGLNGNVERFDFSVTVVR